MDEHGSDRAELSPAAVTLLEAILRNQRPLQPASVRVTDVSLLVRYLAGALSAEETQAMDETLNATREARDRLRSTRVVLRQMQTLSWAEVAKRAEVDDEAAPIGRAWLALVSERITAMQRAQLWWRSHTWMFVSQEVTAGVQEAQAAWTAFRSFVEQWKLEMGRPRVAVAKGSAKSSPSFGGEAIEGAQLDVEIVSDGALSLTLTLPFSAEQPDTDVFSRRAHFSLTLNGEVWPLTSHLIESEVTTLIVPAVGTALGLLEGRIPSELIRIDFGDVAPLARPERLTLLAEVWDRSDKPAPGSPAAIELSSAPHWEAEQVTLEVSVPSEIRDAFPTHHLELELIISSRDAQHLGTWPISRWQDGPQTLTIDCPGCPDAAIPFVSCLRAHLRTHPL